MDRPEEVLCFHCKVFVGYQGQGALIWTCGNCGRETQLNRNDQPIEATPQLKEIVKRMKQLDDDFNQREKPFRIYFSAGRGRPGKYFDPSSDVVSTSSLGTALLLALVGIFLLFIHRGRMLGVIVILAAYWVYRFLDKNGKLRMAQFQALEAERMRQQNLLLDEAKRISPS